MSFALHEETDPVTGVALRIVSDDYPDDPRASWDHFGKMVCWHRRYTLGDAHNWPDPGAFEADMKGARMIRLPLFLYDHSGLTMNTGGFSCPWDSGQVGWIYATREAVLAEYRVKRLTKAVREAALELFRAEVSEYDSFLRGDVWTVRVEDRDGDLLDACGGFIGGDYAIEEGREMWRAGIAAARERDAAVFAGAAEAARPDLYAHAPR